VSAQFTKVAADRHAEAPKTLDEPVPQPLTAIDQFGLWGNLGVSLLGFTGALFVLQPGGPGTPGLSLAAALPAIIVGTILGTLPVALAGVQGARTGAPAMVLLRGLFGTRLSYLPTALNLVQLFGWGTFEVVTIATAAHAVAAGHEVADRVHQEVLDALPEGQRGAFTDALSSLVSGLLAEPAKSGRPVRRARVPG